MLTPEDISVLDGACKPKQLVVTRHGIQHDVMALLKRGFTTTSAGGFFFVPYLLQLSAYDLLSSMGPAKPQGIPQESLALGIVFESIFGYTAGIRAVDSVSRTDFGLLAGLPFLPSPSTQYRYLQSIPVIDALDFQTSLGRRLVKLDQITPGFPVNIDGHNIKTYSRKEMKLSFITKEGRYGKAIRTFYTQDQNSKKPLMAMATYSGTSVSQITRKIIGLTKMRAHARLLNRSKIPTLPYGCMNLVLLTGHTPVRKVVKLIQIILIHWESLFLLIRLLSKL